MWSRVVRGFFCVVLANGNQPAVGSPPRHRGSSAKLTEHGLPETIVCVVVALWHAPHIPVAPLSVASCACDTSCLYRKHRVRGTVNCDSIGKLGRQTFATGPSTFALFPLF